VNAFTHVRRQRASAASGGVAGAGMPGIAMLETHGRQFEWLLASDVQTRDGLCGTASRVDRARASSRASHSTLLRERSRERRAFSTRMSYASLRAVRKLPWSVNLVVVQPTSC
jgi:hypothetical protein